MLEGVDRRSGAQETGQSASVLVDTREAFEQCIDRIITQECDESYAVLIIGIDRFKALNETMGHAVGDEILDLCRGRLASALREQDRLVRLPGDEFAILLRSQISLPKAKVVADRLHDLLHRSYLAHGHVVNSSASIGIAVGPQHGETAEVLLRRAAMALQSAKASGGGSIQIFDPEIEHRLMLRHALTLDLRKALLLRQLEVHYQPQVNVESRSLTGFEALLRWRHPELGLVSPAEFIPLAEENGLIGMIGEWVLRTACQQAARLPKDIVMAVNASPLQFGTGSFTQCVKRALSAADIEGNRLEIEITEGVLIKNGDAVVTALADLRAMGVRLAMDDFGTGYSSLGQLAKLPFDQIKIDRSLVGGSTKQRAIVRAITTLGEGIGMSTLVEGIETEEQLLQAQTDGCKFAQGYLFGKAVPASELNKVLERLYHPADRISGVEPASHAPAH